MTGRVPTIIPRVVLLLAHFTDRLLLHETTRRPAAQFWHLLYLGHDGNVRASQRSIFALHQHLICECHDDVCSLPWQSFVLVPLATQLSTSVIFLATNTHGKFTFRVWHIEGARHSWRPDSTNLRTTSLLGRSRHRHHGGSVGEWLRRCHHGGEASACCPGEKRHHAWSLRGKTESRTGVWVLIAGVPHAASCGHATHGQRGQGWDWWLAFASSGFTIRGQLLVGRVGVIDGCHLIQASSRCSGNDKSTASGVSRQ